MALNVITAKRIYEKLINNGLTHEGACGLVGNLWAESGLSSTNLENQYEKKLGMDDHSYTAAVDNGEYTNFVKDSAGYGLAQWTYWSRKERLLIFAKSRGQSIGNEDMQTTFLISELQTKYRGIYDVLCSSHSIDECARLVMTKFENPANQSEQAQLGRVSLANQVATAIRGTNVKPVVAYGARGENVAEMQRALIQHGYSCGPKGADGIYGMATKEALGAYQTDHNLTVDYMCGPKTWASLLS